MTASTASVSGTLLSPEQRRIVEFGDGPCVVIAGAGTGKTRVIVERVGHLLEADRQPGKSGYALGSEPGLVEPGDDEVADAIRQPKATWPTWAGDKGSPAS